MKKITQLEKFCREMLRPTPDIPVAEWVSKNVYLPPPQTQSPGYVSLRGREYCIEPMNAFRDPSVTDGVMCFGSQAGKTTIFMGAAAWSIGCDPCGMLWVMPSVDLARSFSTTRWLPMLEHSPVLSAMLPRGVDRHDVTKLQQQIGGSVINFIGSNSPANLASRPARRVILDEVDKFPVEGGGEADAVNLAEQRTKSFSNAQRWKSSTPTIEQGLIWQEFLKGDQRRYFVPCPECQKDVVFAWSANYTIFAKTGSEAFIHWDAEAKHKDGSWDLDAVQSSAHALCPHCSRKILDHEKAAMIAEGKWVATSSAAKGFRSWHLPSLYAVNTETSFGRLAVTFLQQQQSALGVQGFINGALAEPYQMQDTLSKRVEVVASEVANSSRGVNVMTVDCQASTPHFWYAIQSWNDATTVIDAGSCDTWQEVEKIQAHHKVSNISVGVDSGFGARSESDVYLTCADHSDIHRRGSGLSPACVGWMPMKGMPGRKRWKDATGVQRPYFISYLDPYQDSANAGQVTIGRVDFSTDFYKDLLASMRRQEGKTQWSVLNTVGTETFWKHMDAEHKIAVMTGGHAVYKWMPRYKKAPNHIFDCCVMQLVMASILGLLKIES